MDQRRNGMDLPRGSINVENILSENPPTQNTTNTTSSYQARPLSPLPKSEPSTPVPTEIHPINHICTPTQSPPPTFKSKSAPPTPPPRRSGSFSQLHIPNSPTPERHNKARFIPQPLTEPKISIPVKTSSTTDPHVHTSPPSGPSEVRTDIPASGTRYSPSPERVTDIHHTTSHTRITQFFPVMHSSVAYQAPPNAQRHLQNLRRGSLSDIRDVEVLIVVLLLVFMIPLWSGILRRGEENTVVLVLKF